MSGLEIDGISAIVYPRECKRKSNTFDRPQLKDCEIEGTLHKGEYEPQRKESETGDEMIAGISRPC